MIGQKTSTKKKEGGGRNWKRIIAISLILLLAGSLFVNSVYAFALGGNLIAKSAGLAVGVYSGVEQGVSDWGDIDVQGQTDEQVADTIYNNMVNDGDVYAKTRFNQDVGLNRSDETALSYAKIEVVQSLEEGDNISTALDEGRSAIDEFYVEEHQKAVLNTWSDNVLSSVCTARDSKMKSIQQTGSWDANDTVRFNLKEIGGTEGESHLYYLEPSNDLDVPVPATNKYNKGYITNESCQDGGLTKEVELLDGSTMDVNVLQLRNTVDQKTINYTVLNSSYHRALFEYQDPSTAYPPEDGAWENLHYTSRWHNEIYDEIENKHEYAINQLGNESSGFVYEVYQAYEQGDLENASDLLSVYDLHRQSTGQLNTTEWATLQLNAQDIPTAFDTRVTVETGDGRNLTGEFYTQAQPYTGDWEVGTQYGDNVSDPVFIVSQESVSTIGTETTFTITDAVKNNESIENFTSSDVGMANATADNILEKIDLQQDKMDELEGKLSSGFGGGLLDDTGSALLIAGGIVVVIYFLSQSGGSGGGINISTGSNSRKRRKRK
jgi:hypothetical protein